MSEKWSWLGCLPFLAIVAAWFTHIFVCVAAKAWMLMVAGALFIPIAILHGFCAWFGFKWV